MLDLSKYEIFFHGLIYRSMFSSKGMDYGKKNEKEAVDYLSLLVYSKEKFDSGLLIDPSIPWLGATADVLLVDKNGVFCLGKLVKNNSNPNITL